MPSIENPTWYEHAIATAPGHADDFFKWLDEADAIDYTGDIASPVGHVMLYEVDSDIIATYVSTFGDPWMSEARNFNPGWYIIRQDDNGFVWGMEYDVEAYARADFNSAAELYAAWCES